MTNKLFAGSTESLLTHLVSDQALTDEQLEDGCQLALGALGVTVIYGILRFSNFAHGETMAFGTMTVILFTWLLQSWGVSLGIFPTALLALPFGIAVAILLVLGTDRVVYKFYRKKKSTPVTLLIASLGVMFFYNGLIRFIIGPGDQIFTDGNQGFSLSEAIRRARMLEDHGVGWFEEPMPADDVMEI